VLEPELPNLNEPVFGGVALTLGSENELVFGGALLVLPNENDPVFGGALFTLPNENEPVFGGALFTLPNENDPVFGVEFVPKEKPRSGGPSILEGSPFAKPSISSALRDVVTFNASPNTFTNKKKNFVKMNRKYKVLHTSTNFNITKEKRKRTETVSNHHLTKC